MDVLLVAPVFDEVTVYSHEWGLEAAGIFPDPPVKLEGGIVTRQEVMDAWKGKDLLAFYNHGNETALYGCSSEKVVDLDNVDEAPPVIYTMACLSAQKLGVEAWKQGRVYWGYNKPFSFTTNALDSFKELANNGLRLVIQDGKTWGEALTETKDLGEQLRKELMDQGRFIAASCMQNDTDCLRCYDGEAPEESGCGFRQAALDVMGTKAWWITRTQAVTTLIAFAIAVLALFFHYSTPSAWGMIGLGVGLWAVLLCYMRSLSDFLDLAEKTAKLRRYLGRG